MKQLTNQLFQTYANDNESIRIDILYNNSFDFFYFETYKDDVLIQGNTKIVNDYENDFIKLYSLQGDKGSFEMIETFSLEFKV